VNWRELKERGISVVGGAVSGGLDSCTVTHWLTDKGFDVECFTVDLGQPDEETLTDVADRMRRCGATASTVLSGQAALASAGLKVVHAQARYEGGYWNTTGIARPVTVQMILPELNRQKIGVLFHGATGRGNDQVRFQLAANVLAPNIEVYAPWRDPEFISQFPGRKQMIEYCKAKNLPIKPLVEATYSTDANFLGLTHEAGDLEDVTVPPYFVKPGMGLWPWDAPDKPEMVTLRWQEGVPVELNGTELGLVEMFKVANQIAGNHGVGVGTHVIENRFVGTKSRGIYEAPGMELLGLSYEYLMQFVLDRRARSLYEKISAVLSGQIYDGYWFDVATTSALAALEPVTRLANGTIKLRMYKGRIYFETADQDPKLMPNSLYSDDSSMEELGSYDHTDSEGLLRVLGVSAKQFGSKQFPRLDR
jgi:argininosuccinate synthase